MKIALVLITLAGALALPGRFATPAHKLSEPARYAITDIGTLGGKTSEAFGLNAAGLVVGRSDTATGKSHAFVFFPNGYQLRETGQPVPMRTGKSEIVDLTRGEANSSEARAINSMLMIAGSTNSSTEQHAMAWNRLNPEKLGPNKAYTVNDHGQVGGDNITWQMDLRKPTTANSFKGDSVFSVYGIGDAGDVVGAEMFDDTHGTSRPFLMQGTKIQTLAEAYSKGASGAAYAVNNKGQVVGTDGKQAFLWQHGKTTSLSTAEVRSSVAYAINEQGQVVGQADISLDDKSFRAVLWEDGRMIDLNACIAPDSGWTLTEARGINQSGQICGTGVYKGNRAAFLLTPHPPHLLR